ncbi:MAG: diguanylate cyclase [Thermomicrobiales bacterium]
MTGSTASNRASETPARSISALLALQHLFASFNRRADLPAAEAIQELTAALPQLFGCVSALVYWCDGERLIGQGAAVAPAPVLCTQVAHSGVAAYAAAADGHSGAVCVPIYVARQVRGVLQVEAATGQPFDPAEALALVGQLEPCAAQLGAVLERAELRAHEQRREQEFLSLQRIGAIIAGQRGASPETALTEIAAVLAEMFDYHLVVIAAPVGRALVALAAHGYQGDPRLPAGRGLAGRVARTGQAVLLTDTSRNSDVLLPGALSAIGVPIRHKDRTIGVLMVERTMYPALDVDDLDVLKDAGEQISVLLANARLDAVMASNRAETERRAAGLATLLAAGAAITAQTDYPTLLATNASQLERLVPHDQLAILLRHPDSGDMIAEWWRRTPEPGMSTPPRVPRGEGLCGWAVAHSEPVLSNDAAHDARSYYPRHVTTKAQAVLIAPLPSPAGALGVLYLDRQTGPDFTPLDMELVVACGQLAGGVMAQARLRDAEAQRARELAALNEIARAVSSLDLNQVLSALVERTRAAIGADTCTLLLLDDDDEMLRVRAAAGLAAERLAGATMPLVGSISELIVSTRQSQYWDDLAASSATYQRYFPDDAHPGAVIGAPLIAHDRVIGTLFAANVTPGSLTSAQLHFLTTVAAQATVALENARLYAEALRLARYDSLTGLANRRHLMEMLAGAVELAERYDRPLALLIIDLDNFKQVNDSFGHAAGDMLLREVAVRLRAALRQSDLPARYAGDELAVILPETALPGALLLAERLRATVAAEPFSTGSGPSATLTLSIGVGLHRPGGTVADLLHAADSAMYFAKHGGRNRVCGPEAARDVLTHEGLAAILRGGNQVVIEELAASIDARVPANTGRAARVAMVAVALGNVLGVAPAERELVRGAAMVRDIGEIAIAPDILAYPGPLDERQWTLIRQHPQRGYDLLTEVPALRDALPLVLHHHEHWDGGGYPQGLAGAAIPLGARIIAVADAWVALTSERPYRAACSHAAALTEIRQVAGTQFDPEVVAALPQALALLENLATRSRTLRA